MLKQGVHRLFGWFGCIILLFFSRALHGQEITVNISILNWNAVSKQTQFKANDSIAVYRQMEQLQLKAFSKGYYGFSIDTVKKKDSIHFELIGETGPLMKGFEWQLDDQSISDLKLIGISSKRAGYTSGKPTELSAFLENILSEFEQNGYPFAKISIEKLTLEKEVFHGNLIIRSGPLVKWTKIEIVSAKSQLSTKYFENYFHIEKGKPFNQSELDLLKPRLKQLTYIKETKPAELLFTTEGATLYLYLESKPVSNFSGTVGLQQNPITFKTQFTGDVRLKLQNSFKRGETMELNWRSIQPGSPQLKLNANLPYLFNTPFGLDGSFYLFKRDSSFLEMKSSIGITYFLNSGKQLKAFYSNYQNNHLNASNQTQFNTKSNAYGLSLTHQTLDYLPNPRKGLYWTTTGSLGNRTLSNVDTSINALVYTVSFRIENYLPIGKRFTLKLASTTESLASKQLQNSEALRFGGNTIQRGFLEEELLSTTRTTFSIEPRLLLDQNSNLFVFFDQSWYERNTSSYLNDHPFGFGGGLSFGTNLGIFTISAALGKQLNNPILLRDSKIHVGYTAYF